MRSGTPRDRAPGGLRRREALAAPLALATGALPARSANGAATPLPDPGARPVIDLDPRTSALILVDLQRGFLDMPLAPRSGPEVLAGARRLAQRFRDTGAPVILVRVDFAKDYGDYPGQIVDRRFDHPPGGLSDRFVALAPDLAQPGDIHVTKRQWGAFYCTDLDVQLRRRGIRRVVVGGLATNFGVESTVRQAFEHGYEVLLAEDLCATTGSAELHRMSVGEIMPRLSRVVASDRVRLPPR